MSILFREGRHVHVNEPAELVAVLVQVQDHEWVWVGIGDFSHVLVAGDLDDFSKLVVLGLGL